VANRVYASSEGAQIEIYGSQWRERFVGVPKQPGCGLETVVSRPPRPTPLRPLGLPPLRRRRALKSARTDLGGPGTLHGDPFS
jgi:hypothetical protein